MVYSVDRTWEWGSLTDRLPALIPYARRKKAVVEGNLKFLRQPRRLAHAHGVQVVDPFESGQSERRSGSAGAAAWPERCHVGPPVSFRRTTSFFDKAYGICHSEGLKNWLTFHHSYIM